MFTLGPDLFPRRAGSIIGMGTCVGGIVSMFFSTFTGFVLQITGSYLPMFILVGCIYLISLLVLHLLAPRLGPVSMEGID
jgi:ACS family hexuronate transporter-like MFS transporter